MKIVKLILLILFPLILTACGNSDLDGRTILFFGNTCPHCQELDKTFEQFGVGENFLFEHLEVYENKENANLLGTAALNCGLNTKNIGVPFLYAENECYVGNPEILKYVSEKTGIDFEASSSAKEASLSAKKTIE